MIKRRLCSEPWGRTRLHSAAPRLSSTPAASQASSQLAHPSCQTPVQKRFQPLPEAVWDHDEQGSTTLDATGSVDSKQKKKLCARLCSTALHSAHAFAFRFLKCVSVSRSGTSTWFQPRPAETQPLSLPLPHSVFFLHQWVKETSGQNYTNPRVEILQEINTSHTANKTVSAVTHTHVNTHTYTQVCFHLYPLPGWAASTQPTSVSPLPCYHGSWTRRR